MSPNIRKLYWFHLLNSVALAAVSESLFLDRLFLRMGLNMAQIGSVKGVSLLVAFTVNLLLAPVVLHLKLDRQVVAFAYILRVAFPFGFPLLALTTDNTAVLTVGCMAVLIVSTTMPALANNSIAVLCRTHIPPQDLGRHTSWITFLWLFPGTVVGVACAWYLNRFESHSNHEFYLAFLRVFGVTAGFQLIASVIVLRISAPAGRYAQPTTFRPGAIVVPFRNRRYRPLLLLAFLIGVVANMVLAFFMPFMLLGQKLSMKQINIVTAIVLGMGVIIYPLWGKLSDAIGGRNVMRVCIVGAAVGILAMVGQGWAFVALTALLFWRGDVGLFGIGLYTGQRYLTIGLANPRRPNVYIAAVAFASGMGGFVGSLFGGLLLQGLSGPVDEPPFRAFQIYFVICAALMLALVMVVGRVNDGRPHVTPRRVMLGVWEGLGRALMLRR